MEQRGMSATEQPTSEILTQLGGADGAGAGAG